MICSRSFLSFPFSLELMTSSTVHQVYQGQFGEFTITDDDRLGVRLYRLGLNLAAFSFAIATIIILARPQLFSLTTPLYVCFCLGLGISLLTIHIYLIPLHRLLQVFWLIGAITSLIFGLYYHISPLEFVYNHPVSLWGVGFLFASLTGIYFKEAFCFNRLETKVLTPLVPTLLLGHLFGILPLNWEKGLLVLWAALFLIFALRKLTQPLPNDIGDKSVFEHLKHS
jgi:uncharacterized integral membrane protein